MLNRAVMIACPLLADGMHAMRAAANGGRLAIMAADTIGDGACVSLDLHALNVVIRVQRWILRVGGVVAGLALKRSMAGGKAIERKTRSGNAGRCCKGIACGYAQMARVIQSRWIANLAAVLSGSARMTALAVGFVEPALASGSADGAHGSVATLALNGQ